MASQWYSVVSQKLYLARVLLTQLEQAEDNAQRNNQSPAVVKQALAQAAAEMLIRAQHGLLIMVARCYQQKNASPQSVSELKTLLGYEVPDVAALEQLAADSTSWWSHLAQLNKTLGEPAPPRKTAAAENIIAVAAEDEADFSASALERTRAAMARFVQELEEQHSEW